MKSINLLFYLKSSIPISTFRLLPASSENSFEVPQNPKIHKSYYKIHKISIKVCKVLE